jgi:hypothetical protein
LKEEFDREMDIAHLRFDKGEGKRKERKFNSKTIVKESGLTLSLPERQFFVQLIKFAPGKGPKDYYDFYIRLEEKLRGLYGAGKPDWTRCADMDVHEIVSFVTWGSYDMAVIWDAPNMETANKFLAAWVDPNSFGSSDTLVVGLQSSHVF